MSVLGWLESTRIATGISGSIALTAGLSAVHLLGFTIIIGAAVTMSLRLVGAVLPQAAQADVVGTASRLIVMGLALSVVTGGLLFAGRATSVAGNGIFQTKMTLLAAAVAWHAAVHWRINRSKPESASVTRALGLGGIALWLGLAVTACAFILLE
jgi:hypothetical protein